MRTFMREILLAIVLGGAFPRSALADEIFPCEPMPKVVESVAPEYPAHTQHFRGGRVVMEFSLRTDGTVADPVVFESDIEPWHAEALFGNVKAALLKWHFQKPSQVCRARTTFTFKVEDAKQTDG